MFPAVDALARIRDARVGPALVPLLERPTLAEPVAEALGELGGADVVRPLVAQLNGAGPPAPLARALARLHERYEQRYGGGARDRRRIPGGGHARPAVAGSSTRSRPARAAICAPW